jgi:chromosome segregation ATPase
MDREKDLLKQDLSKQETAEEINKFIEDTELMGGNEDIVELAKQKLQEISTKADTIEKTSESQISQVENMGGSTEEINNRTGEVDKEIETVKTETIEKINEVQNENREETKTKTQETTMEEKNKEYENKFNNLATENNKLNAELDYLFIKNDIPNFTKVYIKQIENLIKRNEVYIEQLKNTVPATNPSFDPTWNIQQNENHNQQLKKRIESAKEDVTGLAEYNNRVDGRGSSANEKISGLTPSQLVYKYYQEIERFNEEDRKYFAPGNKGTHYPHKFDKLNGLIDVAKQEKDIDLLNSIKKVNLELPEEIKAKLIS